MTAAVPADTSAGEEVTRRLLEDGYVVVSGMMPDAEVRAARDDLGRILEATRTGRNAFEGYSTQRIYANSRELHQTGEVCPV